MDKAPELFQPLGGIRPRSSFTEDELAGMGPERRAAFDALYRAVEGEQHAEQNHRDALDAVKLALGEADRCRTALFRYAPKRTFHDEWLIATGKAPQFNPDEATAAAIKECEIALKAAEENLQHARDAERAASMAVKPTRGRVATALQAYLARFPVVSAVDAVHAHIAGQQKRKQENKDQRGHPDFDAPAPNAPVHEWPLASFRANQRGPVGAARGGFRPIVAGRPAFPASQRGRVIPVTDPTK